MAQYDFGTIDPNTKSGTALATDLNSWRNALHSTHGGSSAPSYITAGMLWVDTTSADYELKLYDGAQSIPVAVIDATNNVARVAVDPAETSYITSTTSGQIRHVIASTNIFTTRSTGIQFNLASPVISDSNNNELLEFTTTASAVNQLNIANSATGGAVQLSTVGADTDVSIALMPKGAGGVGIGTDAPSAKLHVASGGSPADLELKFDTGAGATSANLVDFNHSRSSGNFTFSFAGTEAMRINSSGNVGIGTSSPAEMLHLRSTAPTLRLQDSDDNAYTNIVQNAGGFRIDVDATAAGTNSFFRVDVDGSERMRIDSSGNLLVGTTSSTPYTSSVNSGAAIQDGGLIGVSANGTVCLVLNRNTSDGNIVEFRQAATIEGNISVSGTTVSYNGGHLSRWAQFPDNSRPELLKGTVMSNLDQMSNWDNEENEQLNCVQVSTVEGDANVAGVFVAWDSTDDGYNDILLAMTGDMVIRIGAGVTVARGDLLMSAGDGTAKPQGDDIVRSKTIAKVTSTHVSHTYADGSYAVPCVLMAC